MPRRQLMNVLEQGFDVQTKLEIEILLERFQIRFDLVHERQNRFSDAKENIADACNETAVQASRTQ